MNQKNCSAMKINKSLFYLPSLIDIDQNEEMGIYLHLFLKGEKGDISFRSNCNEDLDI